MARPWKTHQMKLNAHEPDRHEDDENPQYVASSIHDSGLNIPTRCPLRAALVTPPKFRSLGVHLEQSNPCTTHYGKRAYISHLRSRTRVQSFLDVIS